MFTRSGEVSEWSKEHAWKVCVRQRTEGSNPSLTATLFFEDTKILDDGRVPVTADP